MNTLAAKYRKHKTYETGGALSALFGSKEEGGGKFASMAPVLMGALDAFDTGKPKVGLGAAKGALSGAAAGSAAGPLGAAAGAVIGGLTGLFGAKKQKRELAKVEFGNRVMKDQQENNYMSGLLGSNPELITGNMNAGYFKNGGSLVTGYRKHFTGGSLVPKSSDGLEVVGRSHEQGGVKMHSVGAELEGKETIKDDYVFSDHLGFAKLHRPLMKAKGIIEGKPATAERINSIKLLNARENDLKLAQEYYKTITNNI